MIFIVRKFEIIIHCLKPDGTRVSYYIGYKRLTDGTAKTGAEAYMAA